jgi:hypothetical protein
MAVVAVEAPAAVLDGRHAKRRPDLDGNLILKMNRGDILWFRQHALAQGKPMAEIIRRILADYRHAEERVR